MFYFKGVVIPQKCYKLNGPKGKTFTESLYKLVLEIILNLSKAKTCDFSALKKSA